jgi:uncharacterized membrane protein YhdT
VHSSATSTKLLPIAVVIFTIGLVAVLVTFGLSAAGHQELPVWLNLSCLLTPLGLSTGMISIVIRTCTEAAR